MKSLTDDVVVDEVVCHDSLSPLAPKPLSLISSKNLVPKNHPPKIPASSSSLSLSPQPSHPIPFPVGISFCEWPKKGPTPRVETIIIEAPFCLYTPEINLLRTKEFIFARPKFHYRGVGYCSLSEAVLGVLLERFIEGFKVQFRENFQVPIGNGRSVDFCINGVLVEYHPVRLRAEKRRHGDFGSRGEYFRFSRQLKKIGKRKKHARNEFLSKTKHHLTRKYFSKRRHFIDQTPALRGFELVVASTLEEFYQKVIRRFATGNPPPFELFSELFATEVKIIAKSINYPSQK